MRDRWPWSLCIVIWVVASPLIGVGAAALTLMLVDLLR